MVNETVIPAAAVEAAFQRSWYFEITTSDVREILEAAAPHMLAACWADAYEKGRERGEWEAAPVTKESTHTNPYRPAVE